MFCRYCGSENQDNALFCKRCGKPLDNSGNETKQSKEVKSEVKSGKGKKIAAALGIMVAVAVLLAGGGFGFKVYREKEFEKELERQQQEWEEYSAELKPWLNGMEEKKENYIMSPMEEKEYNGYVDDIRNGISNGEWKDIEDLDSAKEKLDSFVKELESHNKEQINEYIVRLNDSDISMAMPFDLDAIEQYRSEAAEWTEAGNYHLAWEKLNEWENLVSIINSPLDTYKLSIRQYDISDYPTIKVYLDVTDQNGNFVDNLSSGAFFVNEGRTIDGEFQRRNIITAAKLDENEGISISLVADVSGSMEWNLSSAKQTMRNFIKTVQFEKGDEIELTEFSEYAYVCKSFTNNEAEIVEAIDSMTAYGDTRLYDTLLSEIERIQSRGNAKCIIGFTDGLDNVSVYTAQDVVNLAVAYNIPVFLIGIGPDCDTTTLKYIAESTGGIYENISDISSLESIYDYIYRDQKEVYLLEYDVIDPDNFDNMCYSDIYVRTEDGNGGYVEHFSFEPKDFFSLMYNKFLIAGIDCQTRGERNLLDSGLIITTEEAYADADCVAHQSQASIDSGGVGSRNSSIFEVLVDYDVLNVYQDGDGYILYGMSNYNISKVRKFSQIKNDLEKEAILSRYGNVSDKNQEFWIEENISNYEKLTLVKDTDGKWKFRTRVYEREDGEQSIMTNEVYNVLWQ